MDNALTFPESDNNSSRSMAPSRRTSAVSCSTLPRVESNTELQAEPPATSLVSLMRDASQREEPQKKSSPGGNQSPVRRRSVVSAQDLAKAGFRKPSLSDHHLMEETAMVMRDTSSSDLDNSRYEVALPKKSPLRHHVISSQRRQSSAMERMGSSVSQTSTAASRRTSSASHNNSPTRGRSVVDPQDLAKAGINLMDGLPVMEAVAVAPMRDISEMDNSQLEVALPKKSPLHHHFKTRRMSISDRENAARRRTSISEREGGDNSHSPVRRRSTVSPQDLAKAGLKNSSPTGHMSAVVTPKRGSSKSDVDGTQLEITLPKKSPLHQQIQNRRMSISDRDNPTRRRTSISERDTADLSHSPVRRASVAPEDLVKAGLRSSSRSEMSSHMSAVITPMRDASMSDMDSSQLEVALPKKIRHSIRQSTVERKDSNVSQITMSSLSSAPDSNHNSNYNSIRRSMVCRDDLLKTSLHMGSSDFSTTDDSGPFLPDNASIAAAAVVGPMRDSSGRGSTNFEVALPKKSPLHQQQQNRRYSSQSNNSSNQVRKSLVATEELVKAGLLLKSSHHASSLADDSGHFSCLTSTIIQEEESEGGDDPNHIDTNSPRASTSSMGLRRSATDSQALEGMKRSVTDNGASSKYGLRVSHSSLGRTYTPPAGSSHAMASSSSTSFSVDGDAKIKAGLRTSVLSASSSTMDNDARIKAGLRNSILSAPSVSSTVDNDARVKAGLRNSTMAAMSSSASTISNTVDNDARIKAGLRASRVSCVAAETTPAIPGATAVASADVGWRRSSTAARAASDLSAQDARIKAGLRSSIATSAPARAPSDLSTSDARIKAGLRNSVMGNSSMRSEGEATRTPSKSGLRCSQLSFSPASTASLTPSRSDSEYRGSVGSARGRGLRRSRQADSERTGKGDYDLRTNSTDSPSSSTTSVVDESQRPGAYRAQMVQVQQDEVPLTIERVDSLRGAMSVLGREGTSGIHHQDSISTNHEESHHLQAPRSDHFSMVSSLGGDDLDLEAQSTRELPFADVAPIEEGLKEDEEPKSSRRFILYAVVAGILVLAILGVVIGEVIGSKSSSSSPSSSSPSTSPGEEASAPPMTLEGVFGGLVHELLPPETIVAIQYGKESYPQVKAFQWLTGDPNLASYSIPQRKQRMALAAFYHATNGARWFQAEDKVENPWLDYDSHECNWFSLAKQQQRSVCDAALDGPLPLFEHANYTSLVLSGSDLWTHQTSIPNPRLGGSLIPELAMLTSLQRLDVSSNKLRGSIPAAIEPWLASLDEIVLFDNDLSGTVPASLYSNARQLWLGINNFEPSVIPPTISTQLTSLSLTETNTMGTIPPQLFNPNLQELFLARNQIEGSIPTQIGVASLSVLELNDNEISSSLPTELGLLTNCQVLRVVNNLLSGKVPSELGRLSDLEELMISTVLKPNADLEGSIPYEFFVGQGLNETNETYPAFPNIQHFMLEQTKIEGSIPTQIGLMTSMVGLYMGSNSMLGSLPSELGLMSNLALLSLGASTLESSIPSELGLLTRLTSLDLQKNELTGELPDELNALAPSLNKFLIDDNSGLEGTFPTLLCDIEELDFGSCSGSLCGCACSCT